MLLNVLGKLIQRGSGGQNADGSFKNLHRFVAVTIVKEDSDLYTFPLNGKTVSIREHWKRK